MLRALRVSRGDERASFTGAPGVKTDLLPSASKTDCLSTRSGAPHRYGPRRYELARGAGNPAGP